MTELERRISVARYWANFWYDKLDEAYDEKSYERIMGSFTQWQQEAERLIELNNIVN